MARFMVAEADHYLVRTGWGIPDVSISRKAWKFVGQKAFFIDMTPNIYSLSLQAMTLEKLEFTMPAVFIIGPRDGKDPKDGEECVLKYAKTVAQANKKRDNLSALVRGIVEGESRVVAATMRMEDIFNSREDFRNKIMIGVQNELDEFGLYIYNANIKQLSDTPGSEYFQYIRQKTHEGAVNQAKVEVAKAKYAGDVGEKVEQASTRKEVSLLEADTVVSENRNKNLIIASEAELKIKTADYDKKVQVAHLEADKAADMKRAELQREVEKLRLLEETARKNADILSIKRAQNQAAKDTADAQAYVRQRKADAAIFTREKEGEGMLAIATAQAEGLKSLISAMDGSHGAVLQYLMIERGLFSDIAKCSSDAIRGLNPQIHVWTTDGNGNGNGFGGQNQIQNLLQSLPPLLSTIQDQTGIQPPSWLAQMGPTAENRIVNADPIPEYRIVNPRDNNGQGTATNVTSGTVDTGTGAGTRSRVADLNRRLRPADSDDSAILASKPEILKHFPKAPLMSEDNFVEFCARILGEFGFNKGNCIALLDTCRDELCRPLETLVEKQFGSVFDISGLGGVLSCGQTGIKAGLAHCPIQPLSMGGDQRPKYIFLAFPHIAMNREGEFGSLHRGLHGNPSEACGALVSIRKEINERKFNNQFPDDMEYNALKQKIVTHVEGVRRRGFSPVSLLQVSKMAHDVILGDLEKIIKKTVDLVTSDIAVITGLQIHCENNVHEESDPQGISNYIAIGKMYTVVNKDLHTLIPNE